MKKFRKTEKSFFGFKILKKDEKGADKLERSKLKRLKKNYLKENPQKPMAPHNTTQFLIDKSPLFEFDTDELLGSLYLLSKENNI